MTQVAEQEQVNYRSMKVSALRELATERKLDSTGSKPELVARLIQADQDAVVAAAKRTMRGKSTIENPVREVWAIASEMQETALASGTPLRRRDVVNRCIASGIAPYTARTQYQLWSKASPEEREAKIAG